MPGTPGRSGGHNRKENPQRGQRRTDALSRLRGEAYSEQAPSQTAGTLERPERPGWIDSDPVAVEAFDRIAELLLERETVTSADRDAILLAALAESEYRRAAALIASEGLVADGKPHPATKIAESAWKRWSAALSRLGLDPITRQRVPLARKKTAARGSKYGGILNGRTS